MADFRALCAELVEVLDELNCHFNIPSQSAIVERVHAALAEPEPAPAADGKVADPALRPIPVSERLPGPEDCVPHPRTKRGNWCWGFERCEMPLARPRLWRLMRMEVVEMELSHWLPAHALLPPEVK